MRDIEILSDNQISAYKKHIENIEKQADELDNDMDWQNKRILFSKATIIEILRTKNKFSIARKNY